MGSSRRFSIIQAFTSPNSWYFLIDLATIRAFDRLATKLVMALLAIVLDFGRFPTKEAPLGPTTTCTRTPWVYVVVHLWYL